MSVKNKTVQERMAELSGLVAWFQGPDFSVEQALEKFQEAEKLAQSIEEDVTKLKNDIEVVKRRFDVDEL